MKVKDGFVVCKVGGKTVAVASGELCKEFNGMVNLNGTGEILFKMLQRGTTEEELAENLVGEYGITMETASRDVKVFLEGLEAAGLIER